MRDKFDQSPRPRRRGQSMVEFALTLPLLLLLLFGIIEFGRLFEAWVVIQNAAKAAARYAVTGAYDQTMFTDIDKNEWGPMTNPANVQDSGVPCVLASQQGTYNDHSGNDGPQFKYGGSGHPEDMFASHWNGMDCNPNQDTDQWMRKDIVRLVSITEEARRNAGSLAVRPGYDIPGTYVNTYEDGMSPDVASTKAGWFHVWICSSREGINQQWVQDQQKAGLSTNRYVRDDYDREHRRCSIREPAHINPDGTVNPDGPDMNNAVSDTVLSNPNDPNYDAERQKATNQYDAGGPGDFVEIIVYFNHPLLTPLNFGQQSDGPNYIQLSARRTMINEAYRTTKTIPISEDRSHIQQPPPTPVPTATFAPPTATRVPPTKTYTAVPPTLTPTVEPSCANIKFDASNWSISSGGNGSGIEATVTNNNAESVFITKVTVKWPANSNIWPGEMLVLDGTNGSGTAHWSTNTQNQSGSLTVGTNSTGWLPNWSPREFPGGKVTHWVVYFSNVFNGSLKDAGFNLSNFNDTQITLSSKDSTITCTLPAVNATPPPPLIPSITPTSALTCDQRWSLTFDAIINNGIVRLNLHRAPKNSAPVEITAFSFVWKKYPTLPNMYVENVGAKGSYPGTGNGYVNMWRGASYGSPTTSAGQSGFTPATDDPSDVDVKVWFLFNPPSVNYQNLKSVGAVPSDFNGTSVSLSDGCTVTMADAPNVNPTITPTPFPSKTPIPTTPPPTKTSAPTKTLPPGVTPPTATLTFTPSPVPTSTPNPNQPPTLTPTQRSVGSGCTNSSCGG